MRIPRRSEREMIILLRIIKNQLWKESAAVGLPLALWSVKQLVLIVVNVRHDVEQ